MKTEKRVTCKRCEAKVAKRKTLGSVELGFVCTPWRALNGRLIECERTLVRNVVTGEWVKRGEEGVSGGANL